MKRVLSGIATVLVLSATLFAQDKPADTASIKGSSTSPSIPPNAPISRAPIGMAELQKTYVIGPLDTLTVTVWKEAAISGSFLVRPDGMISLSLLGDVKASGLTPPELSGQIRDRLKQYLQEPLVTVRVDEIRSKTVFLLGEVSKKGPLEMTPGMTLLQAISSAGGVTDYANKKKMYLLRTENGKEARIPVHYKEALKGNSSFDLLLRPGDTIVVP